MLGGPLHTLGSSSHTYIIENLYVERERGSNASTQRITQVCSESHASTQRITQVRSESVRLLRFRTRAYRGRGICAGLGLGVTARGEVESSVVVFVSAPAPSGRPRATVELWQFGDGASGTRADRVAASGIDRHFGKASTVWPSARRGRTGQEAQDGRIIHGTPPTARLIGSLALRIRRHLVADLQDCRY